MNLRLQQPKEDSKTTTLRDFSRKLKNEFRPYVAVQEASDGTHYEVIVGRSKTVAGKIWFDNSRFRANFDLPPRVYDAAPDIDAKIDKNRRLVFQSAISGGEKQEKGHRMVRFAIESKEEFVKEVVEQIERILKELGVSKTGDGKFQEDPEQAGDDEKTEAFLFMATPRQFKNEAMDGIIFEQFDGYGEGKGDYMAVVTGKIGKEEVVEVLGPITPGMPLHIAENHVLIGIIEQADSRQDALDETSHHLMSECGVVDERYGALYLTREGRDDVPGTPNVFDDEEFKKNPVKKEDLKKGDYVIFEYRTGFCLAARITAKPEKNYCRVANDSNSFEALGRSVIKHGVVKQYVGNAGQSRHITPLHKDVVCFVLDEDLKKKFIERANQESQATVQGNVVKEGQEQDWKIYRRSIAVGSITVDAANQKEAEKKAFEKAESIKYGEEADVTYTTDAPTNESVANKNVGVIEAAGDGKWNVDVQRISVSSAVVKATNKADALKAAREASYDKPQVIYQITTSVLQDLQEGKAKSVPDKHAERIAIDTLKMHDAGAKIMGGMTKDEARAFLKSLGYTDQKIAKLEEGYTIAEAKAIIRDKASETDAIQEACEALRRHRYAEGAIRRLIGERSMNPFGDVAPAAEPIVAETSKNPLSVPEGELRKNLQISIKKLLDTHELRADDLGDQTLAVVTKAERIIRSDSMAISVLVDNVEDLLNSAELKTKDLASDVRDAIKYAQDALSLGKKWLAEEGGKKADKVKLVVTPKKAGRKDEEHLVINLQDEHGRIIPLIGVWKRKSGYEDDSTGSIYPTIEDAKKKAIEMALAGKFDRDVQRSAALIKKA